MARARISPASRSGLSADFEFNTIRRFRGVSHNIFPYKVSHSTSDKGFSECSRSSRWVETSKERRRVRYGQLEALSRLQSLEEGDNVPQTSWIGSVSGVWQLLPILEEVLPDGGRFGTSTTGGGRGPIRGGRPPRRTRPAGHREPTYVFVFDVAFTLVDACCINTNNKF